MTINKYIKELNTWFDEVEVNKLAILAGIIGYLLADGSMFESNKRVTASFCNGNEESALQLLNDIELLGFNRNKIHKQVCTGIFGRDTDDPREITNTGYTYSYTGKFSLFLKALGVTIGRRTTQESSIPEFILNGHKEIKRSFLSGIFGGDGTRIGYAKRTGNTYDYNIGTLKMSKTPEHVELLRQMFREISDMLQLFDIQTTNIKTSEGKFDKLMVELVPSQSIENMITFYEEIGFKYDTYKNSLSAVAWL